jgi:hypothetical protein
MTPGFSDKMKSFLSVIQKCFSFFFISHKKIGKIKILRIISDNEFFWFFFVWRFWECPEILFFILRNSESEFGKWNWEKMSQKRAQKRTRHFWTLASRRQTENKKFKTQWDWGACWGCTKIPGRFFEVIWPSREENQDPNFWSPWSPKTGSGNSGDHWDESIRLPKQNVLRKPPLEATECRKMMMLLWSPSRTHENTKQNFPRFLLQILEGVPVAAGWPDFPSFLKISLFHWFDDPLNTIKLHSKTCQKIAHSTPQKNHDKNVSYLSIQFFLFLLCRLSHFSNNFFLFF